MSDAACEVVAVGDDVTQWQPGDRVLSTFFPNWEDGAPSAAVMRGVPGDHVDGFARELLNVPAATVTRMPQGYSFTEGATLPCAALTAWRALRVDRPIGPGQTVLVQGSGGVSIFALQMAKAFGARVIATSSSDEKLERLRALGADDLINYRTTPNWSAAVLEHTDGNGVDLVVEVGGAGTLNSSIACCAIGGHISMIGVLTGVEGMIRSGLIMARQVTVKGLTVGTIKQQRDMVAFLDQAQFRPVIDSVFPLEDLAKAFRFQVSGGHFGKICVSV